MKNDESSTCFKDVRKCWENCIKEGVMPMTMRDKINFFLASDVFWCRVFMERRKRFSARVRWTSMIKGVNSD